MDSEQEDHIVSSFSSSPLRVRGKVRNQSYPPDVSIPVSHTYKKSVWNDGTNTFKDTILA